MRGEQVWTCLGAGACLRTLIALTLMFSFAIGARTMAWAPTGAGGNGDLRVEQEQLEHVMCCFLPG